MREGVQCTLVVLFIDIYWCIHIFIRAFWTPLYGTRRRSRLNCHKVPLGAIFFVFSFFKKDFRDIFKKIRWYFVYFIKKKKILPFPPKSLRHFDIRWTIQLLVIQKLSERKWKIIGCSKMFAQQTLNSFWEWSNTTQTNVELWRSVYMLWIIFTRLRC